MIEEVPNIITNGFKVLAKSIYVPEMSDFEKSEHFFAYLIRIYNESKNSAILSIFKTLNRCCTRIP